MEDGITPRGLIDRVLDSHDEDHTTRITYTRSRSQLRKTPPRSSARKSKQRSPLLKSVATDTITPRTMIEEFMQGHDTVHQSLHKRPRLHPSPKAASPRSTSPRANQSMNKSLNRSLHKKATMRSLLQHSQAHGPTPRTIIQGLLAQGPEETPVASQRPQGDLEETILPSLQGQGKSFVEQDSEGGNSFLDAYHAASQPVTGPTPNSASRSKRTRQRAVSKADFADAVKQTIADLEDDESVNQSVGEEKLLNAGKRKTPQRIRELATSAGLRTIVSPDVTPRSVTKRNRNSSALGKDLVDGSEQEDTPHRSTQSQDDSLQRSTRLQEESLNRSTRSQEDSSHRSTRSLDASLHRSKRTQNSSLHKSIGNIADELMNKSSRAHDVTLNISAKDDTRSKQILMNSLRQMEETVAAGQVSDSVSLRRSPRKPRSPRVSTASNALNDSKDSNIGPRVNDSPVLDQSSSSKKHSKTSTPSMRNSLSSNNTPSSPSSERRTSRKRLSGNSPHTPRSYHQARTSPENIHTATSGVKSSVADQNARSASPVDVERLSSEASDEESMIQPSDPEEEVMVGQVVDENHLEISQGQLGRVLHGERVEVVSIQPLNITAAQAIAVEEHIVHESQAREERESDEESEEEKENELENRSSQASKTHSLFEENSQPQQSLTINNMISGHYDRLQTPVLRNDKSGSTAQLTPFQRLMQAQHKTQPTPKPAAKPKAPAKAAPGGRRRQPSGSQPPRLPSSLTKSIFSHFLGKTVTRDTLAQVEKVADRYWQNVAGDLRGYLQHAGRATLDEADINLLMKRQRIVSEKKSMYRLVEEYLPLQYQKEIIPCATAGNVVTPKSGLYN